MGYAFLLRKPIKITQADIPYEPDGKIYGVDIQRFVSDSTNKVVYIDDAIDSIPARGNDGNFLFGSWENRFPFNRIRPCLVQNGAVRGYLKKNDYRYYEDGTIADITNSTQGDVMIEIPTVYYKFERKSPTKDLLVRYSDTKHDETWSAYAHTDANGVVKDNLYIAAYLASGTGTLMYSRSGQKPTVTKNITDYQTFASNRGIGYDVLGHHQLTLLQLLYVVMFKSLDSYEVLGKGIQTGGTQDSGTTDTLGLFYGDTSNTSRVKFIGIEDIWGNTLQYIKGLSFQSGGQYYYNDEPVGYGNTLSSGVILDVEGTNLLGFVPSEVGTTSSYSGLHYQGLGTKSTSSYFQHGTASGTYANKGMFSYTANISAVSQAGNRSTRLIYL